MSFDWSSLQNTLSTWPNCRLAETTSAINGIYERVLQILIESQKQGRLLYVQDLQALIRHILCSQSMQDKNLARLCVPANKEWPSEQEWKTVGIRVTNSSDDSFIIVAETWKVEWLEGGKYPIFDEVFAEVPSRKTFVCPIDPAISAVTGFTHYTSQGQREAIRSIFFAPHGSTLVINLPTGSGKSLVGYLPALLSNKEGSFTLFIVPTIALAIDQARQIKNMFAKQNYYSDSPLAWHSGLSEEEKILIKHSIRNGTQRILFTSPEAACSELKFSIYEAARLNYLKYFVVDEAHLISQWGDEFRPAFQAISGLRRGLIRACPHLPLKTILMTATITQETLQTLEILFGPSENMQMVAAVHLRPEPRYWVHHAFSLEDKQKKVIEVIRHGPRPFILYVTERQQASEWLNILTNTVGLHRVANFHGETATQDREDIINRWARNQLDGIVATSAFGVGIDKSDVRMVVHACVPETLDRYYQEVGRGGRDGKASISIIIYEDRDIGVAENLSQPTLITGESGLSRWKTMMKTREVIGSDDNLWRVDLSVVPSNLKRQSDYNTSWNLRTLILLARAGIIEMDSEPPIYNKIPLNNDLTELNQDDERALEKIVIRLLNSNHFDKQLWEEDIASTRKATIEAGQRNFSLLLSILSGQREMSAALLELYSINKESLRVRPTPVCNGCPVCRSRSLSKGNYTAPLVVPIQKLVKTGEKKWEEDFPWLSVSPHIITYDSTDKNFYKGCYELLKMLISYYGVREISIPSTTKWLANKDFISLFSLATPEGLIILKSLEEDKYGDYGLHVTKASILYPWNEDPIPNYLFFSNRPYHFIIVPENIRDLTHPLRRYRDTSNTITLNDILNRWKQ